MKNIGKYNGVPCYTCTNVEWKDCYDRGNDNGKQIFIIDGVMVRKNKIVGHYDGQHVKDRYDEQPYYVEVKVDKQKKADFTAENSKWNEEFVEEVKAAQEGRMTAASYEELVKQDIDFSKYSTIVDEFFALLDVN
ncbi:MAG: hypothetical protein J6R67_05295 [Treponema sp.]|nr:hypothetical protein [Treponema sp.]